MDKVKNILCPSSTCTDGSYLLDIVKKDGKVSIASDKMRIDSVFV